MSDQLSGMPRPSRFEEEGAIYHVINRGNYRAPLFGTEGAKAAFLLCLDEACVKAGWVVHAWCLMSNHYHLALETPAGNLVEGMQWLQGTFSTRFNRLRRENGHLFQGRYKSLVVDPGEGIGAVCHYIHLNPVRAKLCEAGALEAWPWTSLRWLLNPEQRPKWYAVESFLAQAGDLSDSVAGRTRYLQYLAWLAEDELARKAMRFEQMSKGWAIGLAGFKAELVRDRRRSAAALERGDEESRAARDAALRDALEAALKSANRTRQELEEAPKMAAWKIALAGTMKARTTATNRWLAEHLHMGSLHEVSRQVAKWQRETTNYKA